MKNNSLAALTAAVFATGPLVAAQAQPLPTVIDACPNGYQPALIDVELEVSTAPDCPLLEDNRLRRLVNRFGTGNVFAYPAAPGTCVSGTGLTGTITFLGNGTSINVVGYSESAQRLFTEADAIDSQSSPLFIAGLTDALTPFASGAAMTVVTLQNDLTEDPFEMTIVMEDRFSLDLSSYPFIDTEDFRIIGSRGDKKAIGRLTGTAEIYLPPPLPLNQVPLTVSGAVCVK